MVEQNTKQQQRNYTNYEKKYAMLQWLNRNRRSLLNISTC